MSFANTFSGTGMLAPPAQIYAGARAPYASLASFGNGAGLYFENASRIGPMTTFAPSAGIKRVFDGSSGGEGFFGGALQKKFTRGNTNLLDAKCGIITAKYFRPPGGILFNDQWHEGNAMFCLEDDPTTIARPHPSMSVATNLPVMMATAAQVTFFLRQAADEADLRRWGEACPPMKSRVRVAGAQVDVVPASEQVKTKPESEWFNTPAIVAELKANPKLKWNCIEHLAANVRFTGFLATTNMHENRVDIDNVWYGNYKCLNHWGAKIRKGDWVGFIIKRDDPKENSRCAYSVRGWRSQDRQYPKRKTLEFKDFADNTDYGLFYLAGRVADIDPLPTYMYSHLHIAQGEAETKGLLGTLGMGRTSAYDALDEATRVSRTALRCIVVSVGQAPQILAPDRLREVYRRLSATIPGLPVEPTLTDEELDRKIAELEKNLKKWEEDMASLEKDPAPTPAGRKTQDVETKTLFVKHAQTLLELTQARYVKTARALSKIEKSTEASAIERAETLRDEFKAHAAQKEEAERNLGKRRAELKESEEKIPEEEVLPKEGGTVILTAGDTDSPLVTGADIGFASGDEYDDLMISDVRDAAPPPEVSSAKRKRGVTRL